VKEPNSWPEMPLSKEWKKHWILDPEMDTVDVADVAATLRRLVRVGHIREGYHKTRKGLCGTCGADTLLVFGIAKNV
jgi:hypothetical protein